MVLRCGLATFFHKTNRNCVSHFDRKLSIVHKLTCPRYTTVCGHETKPVASPTPSPHSTNHDETGVQETLTLGDVNPTPTPTLADNGGFLSALTGLYSGLRQSART